jgi:hypothetical protein
MEFEKRFRRARENAFRAVQGTITAGLGHTTAGQLSEALSAAAEPSDPGSNVYAIGVIVAAAATASQFHTRPEGERFTAQTAETLNNLLSLARKEDFDPKPLLESIWEDFEALSRFISENPLRVPAALFAQTLGMSPLTLWRERQTAWVRVMSFHELPSAVEAYDRWTRGIVDPEYEAADFDRWVARQAGPKPAGRAPKSSTESRLPKVPPELPEKKASTTANPQPAPPSPSTAESSPTSATPKTLPRNAQSCFHNGTPADKDALNRTQLAQVLAEFLRDERTRLPLTISIEGSWGSGKTTFMRMLAKELKQPATGGGRGRCD